MKGLKKTWYLDKTKREDPLSTVLKCGNGQCNEMITNVIRSKYGPDYKRCSLHVQMVKDMFERMGKQDHITVLSLEDYIVEITEERLSR